MHTRIIAMLAGALMLAATQVVPDAPQKAPTKPPTTPPTQPTADARLLTELRDAQGHIVGPMSVTYSGTYEIEGHLSRPHDVFKAAAELSVFIRPEIVTWESRLGPDGATGAGLTNRERGISTQWGTYTLQVGKWLAQDPLDGIAVVHTIGAIVPALVMQSAIDPVPVEGKSDIVGLKTTTGQPLFIRIDPATKLIREVEWPRAHRRLGDISDAIRYTDYEMRSGIQVPKMIEAMAYEDTSSYRIRLTLQPQQPAADTEALNAARTLDPPKPFEPTVASSMLAPGLWAFTHSQADVRCLVVEMSDGLVVLEAPLASTIGEQIIDAIRGRFPEKRMKAVVLSHYHPHHIGGLRAFVEAGCDIYTTPSVEPFVKEILARPFMRQPDRFQKAPRTPVIHIVKGRQDFPDAGGGFTVVDIGKQSQHTDEYLVAYFPKAKLLFEADIGYVQPKNGLFILGPAASMLTAVKAQGWDIGTIVQGWPAGEAAPLPWDTFVKAVEKRK